jgi:hypothetical protein
MIFTSLNKQSKLLAVQALIATTLATHPGWTFRPQTGGFASGGVVSLITILFPSYFGLKHFLTFRQRDRTTIQPHITSQHHKQITTLPHPIPPSGALP